MTNHIECSP